MSTITLAQNLRVTESTPTSLTLAWDPPSSGNAAYYKLWCDYSLYPAPGIPAPQGVQTNNTTLKITGIPSGTQCRCRLWAFDADGNTATITYGTTTYANFVKITVSTPSVAAPTGFTVTSVSYNSIDVAWDGDAEGVTGYRLSWYWGSNDQIPASATSYRITGLLANTNYPLELSARNDRGFFGPKSTLQATTTGDPSNLSAPTGLYQIGRTSTSISFGWSAVDMATSYDVVYRPTSISYSFFDNVSTTNCTITGLMANTSYYVGVIAKNSYGVSPQSGNQPGSNSPLTITTLQMTATTGFQVSNIGAQTADFTWNPNPDAHHYKLVVSTTGTYYETRFSSRSIYGTSATATSLLPGYPHSATLWAYPTLNDFGGGSTELTFNTTSMPAPTDAHFVSGTTTSVTVSWQSPELDYLVRVYSLTISGPGIFLSTANTFNLSHTFTQAQNGIQPNQYYTVRVKANSSSVGADSPYTDPILTYSGVVPVPAVPANVHQTERGVTSIGLAWDESADATFYQVYKNGVMALETESFVATLEGLEEQTSYAIQVKACNFQKSSALSSSILMSTQAPPLPVLLLTPDHLAINIEMPTTFSWEISSDVEEVLSYDIQVASSSDFMDLIIDANLQGSGTGSYLTSELSDSSQYYWHVRANNALGSGQWSETRSFNTVELPPSAPVRQYPASGDIIGLGVVFTWTAGARANEHRLVIARDAQFQNVVREIIGMSGSTTSRYIILNDPNQTFYWKVGAINNGGSTWSNTGMFTTQNVAVNLPAPTGLVASDFTSTTFSYSVKLTWAAVTGATSYTVYYNDGVEQYTVSAPAAGGDSMPAAALNIQRPGRTVVAWVVAYNATGQSVPSVSVNIAIASEKAVDGAVEIVKHAGKSVTLKCQNLKSVGVTSNDIYYNLGAVDTYVTSVIEPQSPDTHYETTLTNLLTIPNKSYTIKRIAKLSNGDPYIVSSVVTLTPVEAPIINEVTPSQNSLLVSWAAVSGASKYYVYIDGRYRTTSQTTNANLGNLTNNQDYSISVSGYNNAGVYNMSLSQSAAPGDIPLPPATFEGFYDTEVQGIVLSWSLVENATGYAIYYKKNEAATWNGTGLIYNNLSDASPVDIGDSSTLTAVLKNGTIHDVYYFGIASKNSIGTIGEIKPLAYNITIPEPYFGSESSAPIGFTYRLENGEIIFSWTRNTV